MGKPTEEELGEALKEAQWMREQGEDPHHAAENYLQSGMAEREHTQLVRAIEKARAVDDLGAHRERPALGL